MKIINRCEWANGSDIYQRYHDEEWGVPVFDDIKLFEFLVLESAQAGLSWITILKRREAYRKAFASFDPEIVATFDEKKVLELLENEGIIRNKKKIEAAINNAKVFLKVQKEFSSFSNYIWKFTNGKSIINHYKQLSEIPAKTRLSEEISKDMKKRGFSFLGPVIIYAHMQATGMVNDHILSCFRHSELCV
ncbi:MAG: DNA-3-methyladenine glycosylase I [Prolixibacteraceae bacterium]|nr:DNA-3-methyladenine glycosylase I [Prolixibacteraceae bacterium]